MRAISQRPFDGARKLPRREWLDQHVVGAAPNRFGPKRGVAHWRNKDDTSGQMLVDDPTEDFAPVAVGERNIDNDNFDAAILTKYRTRLAAARDRKYLQPKLLRAVCEGIATFTYGRHEQYRGSVLAT